MAVVVSNSPVRRPILLEGAGGRSDQKVRTSNKKRFSPINTECTGACRDQNVGEGPPWLF